MTLNQSSRQERSFAIASERFFLPAAIFMFGFAGSESLDTYYVLKLPALFAVLSTDWNSN